MLVMLKIFFNKMHHNKLFQIRMYETCQHKYDNSFLYE